MTDEPGITRESYQWNSQGTKPPSEGDEVYEAGKQPVAEWDNWVMWAITTDVKRLTDTLGDHSAYHEEGGQDEIDLDGLSVGNGGDETVSESSTPKSFTFSGSDQRDLYEKTVVALSNSSGGSATEDMTVTLYDGSDATGTKLGSETKTLTLSDGAAPTETFLAETNKLDTGTYYVEVTQSGSTLSIDQTDVHTRGGEYQLRESSTGDLQLVDHRSTDGSPFAERDSATGHWTTFPAFDTDLDLQYNSLENVNYAAVDEVRARNDDLEVRTSGSGSGAISLMDESNGTDVARAHEGGEFAVPNGPVSVGDDLRTTGGTTIWDATNGYVPQGRLQNDTVSVSYGSHLSGDGSVSLGGTLNLSVDDDFLKTAGDTMAGTLDVGGNDLVDGGTTVWDATNGYVPQGRLQNDSMTVTAGDGLAGGGSVSLGGSTSVSVEPADFAGSGLTDDGSDNLALSNDSVTVSTGSDMSGGGTVSLGGTVSVSVDDNFIRNGGDTMSGTLDMGGNAVTNTGGMVLPVGTDKWA